MVGGAGRGGGGGWGGGGADLCDQAKASGHRPVLEASFHRSCGVRDSVRGRQKRATQLGVPPLAPSDPLAASS